MITTYPVPDLSSVIHIDAAIIAAAASLLAGLLIVLFRHGRNREKSDREK